MSWWQDFTGQTAEWSANSLRGDLEKKIASRPTYSTPSAINDYMSIAKGKTKSEMPGMAQYKSDIGSSTAQGIQNIKQSSNSVSGTLGAVTNLYGGEMKSLANLDLANAQYKEKQQDAYSNALLKQADYQDKAWNWNVGQKYGEDYNYLQSKIAQEQQKANTQKQNFMNIVSGIVGAGAQIGGAIALEEQV